MIKKNNDINNNNKNIQITAAGLKPSVQIGKKGITDESISEIKKQLKRNKIVKVKFLKSALSGNDKKAMAKEIADRTGSELISHVGFTAVYNSKLYK